MTELDDAVKSLRDCAENKRIHACPSAANIHTVLNGLAETQDQLRLKSRANGRMADRYVEAERDRQAWKRRAEAAEAELARLKDEAARVRALADQWNDTPDYTPSEYDKGRVDQRHDMTTQLLQALTIDNKDARR